MATYQTTITDFNQLQVTAGYPSYPGGGAHRGIDTKTPANANTVVRCPNVGGKIIRSELGTGGNWSWGNFIVCQMANGTVWLAAHFASRLVNVGDIVKPGDVIGIYGSTGNVTGPHTHWEYHTSSSIGGSNLGDPSFLLGVPNAIGVYDVEFGGGDVPPVPPVITDCNILVVNASMDGHSIMFPASNDGDGWVYFNNSNYYRCQYTDTSKVQQMGSWGYWQDVSNVTVNKIFNKSLADLPDA